MTMKKIRKTTNVKKTKNQFIEESIKIHGDVYDYSEVEYINVITKVTIICKEHGEYEKTPTKHLQGEGCMKCSEVKRRRSKKNHHKLKRDWSFEQPEDYKLIPLTQGKYAMVDNEDFDMLKDINWYCNSGGYVSNNSVGLIHRYIMDAPDDMLVDHEDGNPLNNRRSNLRLASHQQNTWNSKARVGLKGVHFKCKKWKVFIKKDGVNYNLGSYKTQGEAGRAYDLKALELFGEFAYLNFPEKKEEYLKIIKSDYDFK